MVWLLVNFTSEMRSITWSIALSNCWNYCFLLWSRCGLCDWPAGDPSWFQSQLIDTFAWCVEKIIVIVRGFSLSLCHHFLGYLSTQHCVGEASLWTWSILSHWSTSCSVLQLKINRSISWNAGKLKILSEHFLWCLSLIDFGLRCWPPVSQVSLNYPL